jgi:hypothetical protein
MRCVRRRACRSELGVSVWSAFGVRVLCLACWSAIRVRVWCAVSDVSVYDEGLRALCAMSGVLVCDEDGGVPVSDCGASACTTVFDRRLSTFALR